MRGGKVYLTGGRNKTLQPGEQKRLFKWEMPVGLFGHEKDERDEDNEPVDAAPTVSVTLGVQLGEQTNAQGQVVIFPEGQHVDWSDAFLHVVWGSGSGATDDAEMDIDLINGTSFSLIARDAQFYIHYPIPTSPVPAGLVQPVIDVSISVGIGDLGSGTGVRSARRTVKVGNTTGGNASGQLAIPRFAHGAILASQDATAGATLTQQRSPVTAGDTLSVATIQKQEYQSIPAFTGARGFNVT